MFLRRLQNQNQSVFKVIKHPWTIFYRVQMDSQAGWMSRAEQGRSETHGWLPTDTILLQHQEEETELRREGRHKLMNNTKKWRFYCLDP